MRTFKTRSRPLRNVSHTMYVLTWFNLDDLQSTLLTTLDHLSLQKDTQQHTQAPSRDQATLQSFNRRKLEQWHQWAPCMSPDSNLQSEMTTQTPLKVSHGTTHSVCTYVRTYTGHWLQHKRLHRCTTKLWQLLLLAQTNTTYSTVFTN